MPRERKSVAPEEWIPETGLPDNFDLYVERSFFGTNPKYMGGNVPVLIWEGTSPQYEGLPQIIFSIGADWNIVEGGARIVHPKRRVPVKTSIYGRLLERVVQELKVPMHQYGSPTHASVWEGLGFHMVRETIKFEGAAERGILVNQEGEVTHLMPTAYLGEKETLSPQISPELKAELVKMAQSNPSPKSFQMEAIRKLTPVAKDVLDKNQAFLQDLMDDNGFWKRAREEKS